MRVGPGSDLEVSYPGEGWRSLEARLIHRGRHVDVDFLDGSPPQELLVGERVHVRGIDIELAGLLPLPEEKPAESAPALLSPEAAAAMFDTPVAASPTATPTSTPSTSSPPSLPPKPGPTSSSTTGKKKTKPAPITLTPEERARLQAQLRGHQDFGRPWWSSSSARRSGSSEPRYTACCCSRSTCG